MKNQQKRVSTTPSTSGTQTTTIISSQHGNKVDEKNNFSIAVALLAAQKQRKAGILPSHKNSIPDNAINLSQDQGNNLNNHMQFQQIQNNSINGQNGNLLSNKLNQSFNKGTSNQQQQVFHLPLANNQNQQQQSQFQQQNQGWNHSNSLNKSNVLDTSYGNYMNQPVYSTSNQNQQNYQQQANSFSGQKYSLKTSCVGTGIGQQQAGLNTSINSGTSNALQQTRPSLAQQKLNQLLEQTKGGRQSPSRIAATEQSMLTMNSSFNGNQKQYFNNSFQGQQQFNQVYTQTQNPSLTLPAAYQNQKNSNVYNQNNLNNPGQISHTLQDASPVRKTRQSLELRTRPLLTEGNITSGSNQNNSGIVPSYNMLIQQQDQQYSNNKSGQGSSSNPAPQPHYMLSKPNQKPYAAHTSKDRSIGQQNQVLQSSLIESNRNNSYLAGSGGKQKQQQYFHLNSFNNNTQPASINRNSTISPVSAAATTSVNRPDSYNKSNNTFYNNTTSALQYHPLNTFLTASNNTQNGSAAQVFIQQVKDKINQNRHKGKQNSIGGNGSQNNSQTLPNPPQQSSFIQHGPSASGQFDFNTSGIHNSSYIMQNPNSVKAAQANILNNSNAFNTSSIPPQPQYHHQKNSKSMNISKNSFIANFNIQSPIGNTTQINLNSSKESADYSFLNQNLMALQAQISQSPSIHSIQKKAKIQINNLNTSNNTQTNSQSNPQQFLQQPRAQTQASSRREQDTQKSNMSNPHRITLQQQNQHSSTSQLIDDQTNLSNITTNFITINENNKSSPKIYAKAQQDSFRFFDEVLEDFMQKNRFSQENKLDYFDNFLITLNEVQRRSQVNQKLNFSQQQQQLQNLQLQQNLHQISSSHNTAASLYQNSTQSSASFRFFENLKSILEAPIQNLLQESRQQKLEFEQKKSQIMRELDLERKERAVLEMKIDILEQEKDKLQNLVTTLSKQQQVNSQKSRNQSTNSHTNSHNTSHNNTSNFNNQNIAGFNLNQQEIQMLLAENEKLKNIAKKQRQKMNTHRSKEEKLMKLLYAIRKLGINVDEIYNDNVKTPDSQSPSGEDQNRFIQKGNDFISPEQNHLSQFQPWELSQDHNISQNTAKQNQHQGQQIQNQEQNFIQSSVKKGSEQNSKRQVTNGDNRQKRNKKEKPFYVNSQNEDDEDENQEIDEDDEYENEFSDEEDDKNGVYVNDDDISNSDNQQFGQNNHEISWQGGDCAATDQQNILSSPKQINAENQYKMKFQKIPTKMHTEGVQKNFNNEGMKQKQQGRYSNQNNHSVDEGEDQQFQNIQFIPTNQQFLQYQNNVNNNKTQEGEKQQQNYQAKNNFNLPINNQQVNNNYYNQQKSVKQTNQVNNNNNYKNQNEQDIQYYNQDNSRGSSPQQNYMQINYENGNNQKQNNMSSINMYSQQSQHLNEHDHLYSEKSVTDSESDVLSIPVNEVAYASQSNKMINAKMKDKLKINLGCLQVKDPANNNMHLNLGKLQDGEGQKGQPVHEEIFGYHDEFMNKFDEFSQSWRDAITKEKQRYQNDLAPISHIYVSAL